jgi:hypothetical protein
MTDKFDDKLNQTDLLFFDLHRMFFLPSLKNPSSTPSTFVDVISSRYNELKAP